MNFILHMDVNNLEEIYTIEEQSFIGRLPELSMLMHLSNLKGQCHVMNIFFEGRNILISTFCACAHSFQRLSKAFRYPIQ
jgi:hypothetical protein